MKNSVLKTKSLDEFCRFFGLDKKKDVSDLLSDWGNPDERSLITPSGECRIKGIEVVGETSYKVNELIFEKSLIDFGFDRLRFPSNIKLIKAADEYETLAYLNLNGKKYPAIILIGESEILYAFNPIEDAYRILTQQYIRKGQRSSQSKVRLFKIFVASILPLTIRNSLIHVFLKILKMIKNDSGFPSWPIDTSVDDLYWLFLNSLVYVKKDEKISIKKFWPENKKFCFVSTHDVDTQGGFDNIGLITEAEREYRVY
ncbi:MAG: hypothetical protein ABH950_06610 [Candidatus Altiarchaeota archaeon]